MLFDCLINFSTLPVDDEGGGLETRVIGRVVVGCANRGHRDVPRYDLCMGALTRTFD